MIDGDLLTHLRSTTRPAHERLESISLGGRIMAGTLTPAEYERLIDWQQRTHRLLEPQVREFSAPGYRYSPRTQPAEGSLSAETTDLPTAVGILYVLEGGSLGGSLIHKALGANPALNGYAPFPFYQHQATTGVKQWRAFVAYLRTLDFSPAEIQRAGDSAVATFRQFERAWQ